MACYYIVISSTHLSNGHFRNIKGVFRGPLGKDGNRNLDYAETQNTAVKAANFYCELCDKQYYKLQQYDNHINSYDHAHKQRLKELKQREFARNVASKSWKEEKKQERALRRLHHLAEQRREIRCAPGSGPMFKSTTVAVECSFRETGCGGNTERTCTASPPDMASQDDNPSTCLPTKNRQPTSSHISRVKNQVYREKIAFSFSMPKRASFKLEPSAAVFTLSSERPAGQASRGRCREAPAKASLPSLTASILTEKGLNYRKNIYSFEKPTHESASEQDHRSSERLDVQGQESPEAPGRSLAVTDLHTLLVYSENVAVPCVPKSPSFPLHLESTSLVLDIGESLERLTRGTLEIAEQVGSIRPKGHRSPRDGNRELADGNDIPTGVELVDGNDIPTGVELADGTNFPTGVYSSVGKGETTVVDSRCAFRRPSHAFCSVLSKDGGAVLQWPVEMLMYTRTQPTLSYSCNPLHFDFRAGQEETLRPTKSRDHIPHSQGDSAVVRAPIWNIPDQDPGEQVERQDGHVCNRCISISKRLLRVNRKRKCGEDWKESTLSKRSVEKLGGRERRDDTRQKKRRRKKERNTARRDEGNAEEPEILLKHRKCWEPVHLHFRGNTSPQDQDTRSRTPEDQDKSSRTPEDQDKSSRTPEDQATSIRTPEDQDKSCRTPENQDKSCRTPEDQDKSSRTPGDQDKSSRTPENQDKSRKTPEDQRKSSSDSESLRRDAEGCRRAEAAAAGAVGELAGGCEGNIHSSQKQLLITECSSNDCVLVTGTEITYTTHTGHCSQESHQCQSAKRRRGSLSEEEECVLHHERCLNSSPDRPSQLGNRACSELKSGRKRQRLCPDSQKVPSHVETSGDLQESRGSESLEGDSGTQVCENKRLERPEKVLSSEIKDGVADRVGDGVRDGVITVLPLLKCTEHSAELHVSEASCGLERLVRQNLSREKSLPLVSQHLSSQSESAFQEVRRSPASSEMADAGGCFPPTHHTCRAGKPAPHPAMEHHPCRAGKPAPHPVMEHHPCRAGKPAPHPAMEHHPCRAGKPAPHPAMEHHPCRLLLHPQAFPGIVPPGSPPMLHPIRPPTPISPPSITILHRVLQTPPLLLPQDLPLTHMPLGVDIWPSPFLPLASLHAVCVPFHPLPLPLPLMIPALQPVIPLQPLL